MKEALHFSGLNGLRAIAALSVLFSHTTMRLSSFGLNSFVFGRNPDGFPKTTLLAGFGVSIFFALSGFLITYLLLEENKIKEINIKNFYIRRALRIWPLYYLYLIVSIITLLIFQLPFESKSVLFYIFLLANVPGIIGGLIPILGHYWSIGVEEQFYSFWPWIIRKSKSILTTTFIFCTTLLLIKFILRVIDIIQNQGEMSWLYQILNVTRFQCMLIGAIGAILYFQKNTLFIKITNNITSQLIAWLIIFLVAVNKFHILSFLDNEFISIVTVIIIIGQITKTNRVINLDNSIFNFLGKISYGIYVIHGLTLFYLPKIINLSNTNSFLSYFLVYLSVFSTTIFISYLSYEFFEKKFLLLKAKYSIIRNSGTE